MTERNDGILDKINRSGNVVLCSRSNEDTVEINASRTIYLNVQTRIHSKTDQELIQNKKIGIHIQHNPRHPKPLGHT